VSTASHVVADQREVFAFLEDPGTHGLAEPVVRIDTHGAAVFLAGPDVYKVKRAVRFPFMDYSTIEKRRAACQAEVSVNGPNAPDIYLGVVPITRAGGRLGLGGSGELVECAVHMRRFDETRTLDRIAAAGGLSPSLIAKLARAVLVSHAKAPRRDGAAAAAALKRYIAENGASLAESPELFRRRAGEGAHRSRQSGPGRGREASPPARRCGLCPPVPRRFAPPQHRSGLGRAEALRRYRVFR
jgi:aminoglycoside phosphotransferase family enzyme